MDDFLLLYLSLQYSLRYTQCYPVSLGFYGCEILEKIKGTSDRWAKSESRSSLEIRFFEYENFQRYRQFCLHAWTEIWFKLSE